MLRSEKLREMAAVNGSNNSNNKTDLPHLICVDRFNQLPVVETAFGAVGNFYFKLKRSNSVAEWTLGAAEASVARLAHTLAPPLSKPLHMADSALCRSLDFVEDSLPAVKMSPHELLENMQSLVRERANALTRPVLRRASSVRDVAARRVHVAREYGVQRANSVLNTKVGALAADGLDVGLELAEHLMDTFLPADTTDDSDKQILNTSDSEDQVDSSTDQPQHQIRQRAVYQYTEQNRALHTVHRVDRLTRTLQRRLTRHTLAQVKSLREHAMDAVAYMLGLAHVAVTDPVGAARNVVAVWTELSGDEPENQPPPETVEQRVALLAREAARRVVHLTNAIAVLPAAAASTFSQLLIEILHGARLDGPVHAVLGFSRRRYEQLEALVKQLNTLSTQIADVMISPWKRVTDTKNVHVTANHVNTMPANQTPC